MNERSLFKPKSWTAPTISPLPRGVLQRKCACGGSAGLGDMCSECQINRLRGKPLQHKLTVGVSGDEYEKEADRVAEQVMATPAHSVVSGAPSHIQRYAGQASVPVDTVPASVNQVLASTGRPLEPPLRQDMERRFGYDFGRVRVHSNATAAQSARDLNAKAYTVGHHIMFGAGQLAPGLLDGRRLIAHELTHVLQQSGSTPGLLQRAPDEKKPAEKPTVKFVNCDDDRLSILKAAMTTADSLAAMAIRALERDYPFTNEVSAMKAHFGSLGSDQKATIIERYKNVRSNLNGKNYTCAKDNKKVKEGNEVVDICGRAACPGNNITLFPVFGSETCPAGPVLLHEAVHNAGACDDIKKGSKDYPPSTSEDNAYSYENFVLALAAGEKEPELKKRQPSAPKAKI